MSSFEVRNAGEEEVKILLLSTRDRRLGPLFGILIAEEMSCGGDDELRRRRWWVFNAGLSFVSL